VGVSLYLTPGGRPPAPTPPPQTEHNRKEQSRCNVKSKGGN